LIEFLLRRSVQRSLRLSSFFVSRESSVVSTIRSHDSRLTSHEWWIELPNVSR